MLRRGRLARLARLGGMAAGFVSDAAGAAAHRVTGTEELSADFHKRAAKRMLEVFGDMRGLPLKAGQMLSYIDEMLPEEHRHIYNEVLGKLQVHTPPMNWEDIEAVFHEEFDGRGPEEVFAAFDHEPIAAASIGQVYRATLHSGEEVVVKVQYPGVAEAMASDMDNADTLVSLMNTIVPKMHFSHFVDEITSKVKEELDYVAEAQNQRDFAALWEGDPKVVIPKTYSDLCTRRVLTSEFLEGAEWKDMLEVASPELQAEYGRTIFRFVFQSLFCHGMFNGDPHPGNYLFYPDGRIGFIDYGCTVRYDEAETVAFREFRHVVLARATGAEFQHHFLKAFGIPADLDPDMLQVFEDYLHLTFEPITAEQPYHFTREYSKQLLTKMMDLKMVMNKKIFLERNANMDLWNMRDAGVAFLGRINFGLGSILATLGTEGDFRAILEGMEE